ncbi:MAG: hypothetical protein M0P93_05865 [Candidatus Cloacimonetes bacterium]|nr:hypothetical protein [Candidatus Cloacimonadota bacterium]
MDLFSMVHIGDSAIDRVIGSCLNLNKNELLIFFHNQVYLALLNPKVPVNYLIATAYKIVCS